MIIVTSAVPNADVTIRFCMNVEYPPFHMPSVKRVHEREREGKGEKETEPLISIHISI